MATESKNDACEVALLHLISSTQAGAELGPAFDFLSQHCLHSDFVVQVCTLRLGDTVGLAYGQKLPEDWDNIERPPEMLIGWLPPFQPDGADLRDGAHIGHFVFLFWMHPWRRNLSQ